MDLDLVELCRQATVLVEETLRTRTPGSARPAPDLALTAVPTPELATGEERHELSHAAVEKVHQMLGPDAAYSVSHTRAVSVVIGAVGRRVGIDLERVMPARPRIAQRVLTSRELETLGAARTWLEVLRCFCLKEATYKVLDKAEQENLRFRGLQLDDAKADCTRVHRSDDQRCVAVAGAARGTEVLIALAAPSMS
jgi:4'-phosphopantetheinyl transferase EntD